MRTIEAKEIEDAVARLCVETNIRLEPALADKLRRAAQEEDQPLAASILGEICRNIEVAGQTGVPLCQDTGLTCVFVEVGQDVHIAGGWLNDAINRGVARGYTEGYLRKSVVADPLRRTNTGDNTPARIVTDLVPGDSLKITVAPKGFGSENMGKIKMCVPADGRDGVMDFVTEAVRQAGGKPCPPMVVGVGIGGTFDQVAELAKRALLEPIDASNPDPYYAQMEQELLDRINALGIGPQGFGGKTTALAVHIKTAPTHIAGLPVAVNINCHVSRHASVTL
jgi:fumarate hydratase subunit alpha